MVQSLCVGDRHSLFVCGNCSGADGDAGQSRMERAFLKAFGQTKVKVC